MTNDQGLRLNYRISTPSTRATWLQLLYGAPPLSYKPLSVPTG